MKKKNISFILLIILECAAIMAGTKIVNHILYGDDGVDERVTHTYGVRESSSNPVEYSLVHQTDPNLDKRADTSEETVRSSSGSGDDDMAMQVYDEQNGFAVVRDGKWWNVYNPMGSKVFREDFEINPNGGHGDCLDMVDKGRLIANRATGEYFDVQGAPVSNLYTALDRMIYEKVTLFEIGIFTLLMLLAALVWLPMHCLIFVKERR